MHKFKQNSPMIKTIYVYKISIFLLDSFNLHNDDFHLQNSKINSCKLLITVTIDIINFIALETRSTYDSMRITAKVTI